MSNKIPTKWKIAGILALLIGIIIGFTYQVGNMKQGYEASLVEAKKSASTVPKEKASAEWVYKNSTKISSKTSSIIVTEAFKYKNPILLLAVFQAESEFNPTALSHAGAIGLGQIMWKSWGDELKKAGIAREARDLYDIATNVQATSFVLDTLLKTNGGDIQKTLTSYLGAHQKPYQDKIAYNFLNLSLTK